jgi:hypothetical protein
MGCDFAAIRHERSRLWLDLFSSTTWETETLREESNKETRMSTRNNVCHSLNLFPQSLTKKDKFPSTYFLSYLQKKKRKKKKKLVSSVLRSCWVQKVETQRPSFWNCLMIDNHLSLSLFVSLLLSINRLLLSQFSLCSAFRWSILLLNSHFISFTYTCTCFPFCKLYIQLLWVGITVSFHSFLEGVKDLQLLVYYWRWNKVLKFSYHLLSWTSQRYTLGIRFRKKLFLCSGHRKMFMSVLIWIGERCSSFFLISLKNTSSNSALTAFGRLSCIDHVAKLQCFFSSRFVCCLINY